MKWLEALADKFALERFVINDRGSPYLTRWTLWGKRFVGDGVAVFLHKFHRSDRDDVHDHPWGFTSIILSGGYWEHTPVSAKDPGGPTRRRWYGPGRILRRPAEWRHRIEIPEGGEAWTLIFRGRKTRSWFFWCPLGAVPWRDYIKSLDAGLSPCG